MQEGKRVSHIVGILAALATVGAFVLSTIGVVEKYKEGRRLPKHLKITRHIEVTEGWQLGSKRELLKVFSNQDFPEGFSVNYKGVNYKQIWRERWIVENMGSEELFASSFHHPITASFSDQFKIVATSSSNFTVNEKGDQIALSMDLINPGERIEVDVYYAHASKDGDYDYFYDDDLILDVSWKGKIIGNSKLEFLTDNYLEKMPPEAESQIRDLKKMFNSKISVWLAEWDIGVFLCVFSVVVFFNGWLVSGLGLLESRYIGSLTMVGLMMISVSFSEVVTFVLLGRFFSYGWMIWIVWMPILLLQIAVWLYLLRRLLRVGSDEITEDVVP